MALERIVDERKRFLSEKGMANSVSYYMSVYDDILIKQREKVFFGGTPKENLPALCAAILEEIFTSYHKLNAEQVRDALTSDLVDAWGIRQFVEHIPCPPEIDRKNDYRFVAWYIWPKTKNVADTDLIKDMYYRILSGEMPRYPKKYFMGPMGRAKAKYIFQLMLEKFLSGHFTSITEAYVFFSRKTIAGKFLKEHGLLSPAKIFNSPLEYFHYSLAPHQRDNSVYRMLTESSDPQKNTSSNSDSKSKDTRSIETAAHSAKDGLSAISNEVSEEELRKERAMDSRFLEAFEDITDLYDYAYDDLDTKEEEIFVRRILQ